MELLTGYISLAGLEVFFPSAGLKLKPCYPALVFNLLAYFHSTRSELFSGESYSLVLVAAWALPF